MLKVFNTLLYILVGVTIATCYCPRSKTHAYGECMFQLTCLGTIRDVDLPDSCREATNYPVIVKVNLNEAVERFDKTIDIDFLGIITYLKISAQWKETTLEILQYTSKLRTLVLVDIGLESILGSPFYSLSRLEDLNLSFNNLTDIRELFQFETHPNKLNRLWLAHNEISEVPATTFEELSSLTELDLSYNSISDLSEEPFCNLTMLETLWLNNNKIKNLNGAVNSLQVLKHLYLRGNQIENIDDESLKIIQDLETFDVSRNYLEQIKPFMFLRHYDHFGNYSKCKIILSDNIISNVPNGPSKEIESRYAKNVSIHIHTEVDLSRNAIESIALNAFQSLMRLESLDLSRNKLKDFSVNADDVFYVKYLNLSSNHISHLYFESFSRMNNLQKLDLSNNRLDFIPDMTFISNYNLKLVNMTYNAIEKLERIHIIMFHPEGGVLDLSNNTLSELKVPLGEGIRLITLILHSNKITNPSLIDLSFQTDLKTLDMSINQIRSLNMTSLRLPVSLENLDLSCNKMKQISPSTFHTLLNLKFLRLRDNKLRHLEYGAFHGLGSLYYLDLSYNNIGALDSNVLTDLKSLQILSLRSNDMNSLDYRGWYDHKFELKIYIDNNNLTCEWLAKALHNYHNEFSKMRPVVLVSTKSLHSVEGIPCLAETSIAELYRPRYQNDNAMAMTDERLLIISQKILEAVREENSNLRRLMWFSKEKRGIQ